MRRGEGGGGTGLGNGRVGGVRRRNRKGGNVAALPPPCSTCSTHLPAFLSSGVLKSNGDSSGTMLSRSGSLLSVRKVMDVEVRALNGAGKSGPELCVLLVVGQCCLWCVKGWP